MIKRPPIEEGEIFGRLVVLYYTQTKWKGVKCYMCQCECGNIKEIASTGLRSDTRSCGCLNKELSSERMKMLACGNTHRISHDLSNTRIYRIWQSMKRRCSNPNTVNYAAYGGSGITYPTEWELFENFYQDMGEPPTEKHSLDREDGTKSYSKSNCKWATSKEQNNNRRDNIILEFEGESKTLAEWADVLNANYWTLRWRFLQGWSTLRILGGE